MTIVSKYDFISDISFMSLFTKKLRHALCIMHKLCYVRTKYSQSLEYSTGKAIYDFDDSAARSN